MTKHTTEPDIGEPLRAALSDYMMATAGRRPTQDEMWNIYWSAVEAIDEQLLRARLRAFNSQRSS